jgi:hypothetical protein
MHESKKGILIIQASYFQIVTTFYRKKQKRDNLIRFKLEFA